MLACGKLDFRWRTYVRNDGIIVVSDPLDWADKYRKHAVECMQLAKTSFDESTASQYRLLAGRYIKLAECEEELASGQANRAQGW